MPIPHHLRNAKRIATAIAIALLAMPAGAQPSAAGTDTVSATRADSL